MNQGNFEEVADHIRKTALLRTTLALLEWDERTGLPAKAGAYRAEQATLLSGMIHRRQTDPRLGEQLEELAAELPDAPADDSERVDKQAASVRRLLKEFRRNSRLPVELVEAISKATVLGQQAWDGARKNNDWDSFRPHMEEIFSLRRQQAELLRVGEESLYDALLDEYEEGARTVQLVSIFSELRDGLVTLVQDLDTARRKPTGESWRQPVEVDKQRHLSRWIAEQIGYRFDRGRLDETSHPFCTTLGPDDCRILTRYHREYFPCGFYGTLHEAGHGLYEQGLPTDWFGLPPGTYASLGVHESQSRMWENFVGRSRAFWKWCFPHAKKQLAGDWDHLSEEQLYRDANLIQPSLIRVEADEVTYNLHILIRFEIERELLTGELAVDDAPDAWNQRYQHYLGICPPSNRNGILQDVHWSAGLVGYFPTYTLGNLYAAQLMEAAESELGNLGLQFEKGEFASLLEWLRTRVHQHGFSRHPGQLIQNACGQTLEAAPLLKYLRAKLEPIYGLA